MLGGDAAAGPYGLHEAKPHGPRIPHIRFQEGRIEGKGQEKFPVVLEHSVGRRRVKEQGGRLLEQLVFVFLKGNARLSHPEKDFPRLHDPFSKCHFLVVSFSFLVFYKTSTKPYPIRTA